VRKARRYCLRNDSCEEDASFIAGREGRLALTRGFWHDFGGGKAIFFEEREPGLERAGGPAPTIYSGVRQLFPLRGGVGPAHCGWHARAWDRLSCIGNMHNFSTRKRMLDPCQPQCAGPTPPRQWEKACLTPTIYSRGGPPALSNQVLSLQKNRLPPPPKSVPRIPRVSASLPFPTQQWKPRVSSHESLRNSYLRAFRHMLKAGCWRSAWPHLPRWRQDRPAGFISAAARKPSAPALRASAQGQRTSSPVSFRDQAGRLALVILMLDTRAPIRLHQRPDALGRRWQCAPRCPLEGMPP